VNPTGQAVLILLGAYLIGSIPFGFLVAKLAGGVDIRTVGSGNIGATNVGRVLGFRYFLVVFLLDLLKGMLPTLAAASRAGRPSAALAVGVAVATILGHNFPVYLKFRGGKGVATSLGAVGALDPIAGAASATVFVLTLVSSRFVSLSSLLGGLAFVLVHFARADVPIATEQIPMTAAVLALLALLVARHRANIGRIVAGTEPKVSLSRKPTRSGRVPTWMLFAVVATTIVIVAGASVARRATRVATLELPGVEIREVARIATGHQRADGPTFSDGDRLLTVNGPRYNHLLFYRIAPDGTPTLAFDRTLEGRPVATRAAADRIYVLQRPVGDARHLQSAWWETFDFQGHLLGSRHLVGFDPDDMALAPDGSTACVLRSGNAEGETNRPDPDLLVVGLRGPPTTLGRVDLNAHGRDPHRFRLDPDGRAATVTFVGSPEIVRIDLHDPAQPRVGPLIPCPTGPGDPRNESVALARGGLTVRTLPMESGLAIRSGPDQSAGGTFPLRGALGFGTVLPTGLASTVDGRLLAVTTRSGGVHIIEARSSPRVAAERTSSLIR